MQIRGILLDIDGTLFIGPNPIPGSDRTLRRLQELGIPYRFLSNGTRSGRQKVREKLLRLGLPVSDDQILTPATAVVIYLKERGFSSCMLLSTEELAADILADGIAITGEAPVLVVGDAWNGFTYASMNQAFRAVMEGALLIALEKDRFWKDGDGPSLGAGAFVAGIEYATGTTAQLMGKPSLLFYEAALRALGTRAEETLMVGDDIMSDIGGAQAAGITGVLVETGKCNPSTLRQSGVIPGHIIPSIASLPDLLAML